MVVVLKANLVFMFGPNLKTKALLRPRPKLNNNPSKEKVGVGQPVHMED